jgi:hypothetical protein
MERILGHTPWRESLVEESPAAWAISSDGTCPLFLEERKESPTGSTSYRS